MSRYETVFGHDDEVREESSTSLDHTDLTVRYADQSTTASHAMTDRDTTDYTITNSAIHCVIVP